MRAAEDDRVHAGILQRLGIRANRVGDLLAERIVRLDERDESRARDRNDQRACVERAYELDVSAARDRRLRREETDPAVSRGEDSGMRLGREDSDDGNRELALKIGERGCGRRVAGRDDELHALLLEIAGDLGREAPDLVQRARPVRQTRTVAEVHEVLVREGDQALVQDGEPAHAGVEHADGAGVHARGF